MHRIHRILVPLFLLVLTLAPAAGQDQPKDEKKYAPMPWHLVDHWWDIGQETPFESLAVDVTISADVPSSVNLYISPIGLGHLSKTPFYGGIQTQADGYTKKDQKLRTIGPGFLFSMWGERSTEAIRPSDGGFFQRSGHEGRDVQVLDPRHYLATLQRRPAALDHAPVLRDWQLPESFTRLRQALEARHGPRAGVRHYVRVLQLCL